MWCELSGLIHTLPVSLAACFLLNLFAMEISCKHILSEMGLLFDETIFISLMYVWYTVPGLSRHENLLNLPLILKGTIIRLAAVWRSTVNAEHRSEASHANVNPRYTMFNSVCLIHCAVLENKVERKSRTHRRTLKGNSDNWRHTSAVDL